MKKALLFLLSLCTLAAAAQIKNVAVVETEIDEQSGAASELTSAEVRLITTELRREAVKNLPRGKYNVMTTETVYAQGGSVLEDCADENCVIALGSRIGADYIVRGIISKFRTRFTLSVEIYDTEDGNLVASSDPVRSENINELLEKSAAVCADMYKTFANPQSVSAPVPVSEPPQKLTKPIYEKGNNIITVDAATMMAGKLIDIMGENTFEKADNSESSAFGIALRYERQFGPYKSMGGRFSYLGTNMKVDHLKMGIPTFCIDLHGRFYPSGKAHFWDGAVGYGNVGVNFSGEADLILGGGTRSIELSVSQSYLRYGLQTGWRILMGDDNGLVFEFALGWDFASVLGKTSYTAKLNEGGEVRLSFDDEAFAQLGRLFFMGGPRLSMGIGWHF